MVNLNANQKSMTQHETLITAPLNSTLKTQIYQMKYLRTIQQPNKAKLMDKKRKLLSKKAVNLN